MRLRGIQCAGRLLPSTGRKDKQMDNQTSSMEVFLKSLTGEQADTCERDEKLLTEIFHAGLSEVTAVQFHRTVLRARRVKPDTTVEGIFEVAFRLGLSF